MAARRGSVGRSPKNETSAQTSVIVSEEGQADVFMVLVGP